jgi:hypothetical protein
MPLYEQVVGQLRGFVDVQGLKSGECVMSYPCWRACSALAAPRSDKRCPGRGVGDDRCALS